MYDLIEFLKSIVILFELAAMIAKLLIWLLLP
jgi:hypothetical protein